MRGWRGWWSLHLLLGAGVVSLEEIVRSEHADNIFLFCAPLLVGLVGASGLHYRRRHGFWPWDRKRRKIERWGWLVQGPPDERAQLL